MVIERFIPFYRLDLKQFKKIIAETCLFFLNLQYATLISTMLI